MPYYKGDIIWVHAKRRTPRMLKHPAIIWDDMYDGNGDFSGIMITHSGPTTRFDNILMNVNHFEQGHPFKYDNSHFVNQLFIKFEQWGPFYPAGRLTKEGINFIVSNLTNTSTEEFEVYRKR